MGELVERLKQRAESYRQSGPSAEHTARLLDEAAAAIVSAESSAEYNAAMADPLRHRIEVLQAEARANARLIAAAPELLAALEAFNLQEDWVVGAQGNSLTLRIPLDVIQGAAAAIAKAKGAA